MRFNAFLERKLFAVIAQWQPQQVCAKNKHHAASNIIIAWHSLGKKCKWKLTENLPPFYDFNKRLKMVTTGRCKLSTCFTVFYELMSQLVNQPAIRYVSRRASKQIDFLRNFTLLSLHFFSFFISHKMLSNSLSDQLPERPTSFTSNIVWLFNINFVLKCRCVTFFLLSHTTDRPTIAIAIAIASRRLSAMCVNYDLLDFKEPRTEAMWDREMKLTMEKDDH